MPQGTVKWFNEEKGFGFITPEEGRKDLFFHHSEIQGNIPNDGEGVEFEIGEGRKGPCATNVKVL